ncbi:MAG: hypothetical protein ACFBSG_01965 [Leptolyngbyaceae cyanobacterium]
MNASHNSDPQLYSVANPGRVTAPANYSPSVPISVYRELASELKTTQTTLDALTQQNQQLLRQNKLLRTEIQRFVQSAEQLGHFAGVMPQDSPVPPPVAAVAESAAGFAFATDAFSVHTAEEATSGQPAGPEPAVSSPASLRAESVSPRAESVAAESQSAADSQPDPPAPSAIVHRPKAKKRDHKRPTAAGQQYRLFTEQPDEGRPLSRVASRSDLGNLWLATTILLVVVSAFGAGFLIMRPLLNR